MKELSPTDLKSILHSKRANIYYLEHCRVLVNAGRVEYVTDQGAQSSYWNIPIANTTTVLLGNGTSLTQAAARELAKAGVMVGFCGGGGSPLYGATDIEWLTPQSEYRPTQYLQRWVAFWFSDEARLAAAKKFQSVRLTRIAADWTGKQNRRKALSIDEGELLRHLDESRRRVELAPDLEALLTEEARLTKLLYRMAVHAVGYGEFTRVKQGDGTDAANRFLDHGNYLAYGLAATATWVLGIPPALAVLHGKTRRGGLVFDVADLVKDAIVLPQAFLSARSGAEDQEFRVACINALTNGEALDFMIDTLKYVAETTAPS